MKGNFEWLPERYRRWYFFALASIVFGQIFKLTLWLLLDEPMTIIQVLNFDDSLFYYRKLGDFIGQIFVWGIGGVFLYWFEIGKHRKF